SIEGSRGIYRLPPAANDSYYRPNPILVLDRDVGEIDIRATMMTNNASARAGLIARASGYADYYAAYITAHALRIVRRGALDETVLAKSELFLESNKRYRIRLQVKGSGPVTVRAKAWRLSQPEPRAWMAEYVDANPNALSEPGPFGIFFAHALDGRGASLRVKEVRAWSRDRPRLTKPALAFAMAGAPSEDGNQITLRAKVAVPAKIGFEVAAEPTFTQDVQVVQASRPEPNALSSKAMVDISQMPASSLVYWRAVTERRGERVVGPTNTFRKAPYTGFPVRFAFGACTRWQAMPHPSFEQVRLKFPDFFLHQGDFGYVNHRVIDHEKDCYQDHWTRMLMDPNLASLTNQVPFAFYQDDSDYGANNVHGATLRRFTIAAHNQISANPASSYFKFRYGDLAVFVIDCRRFSTGKDVPDSEKTKLGAAQKQWLMDGMRQAAQSLDAGLLVVASPQAFGSDNNQESWRRGYPLEWQELMTFFRELRAPVLIVSGDAHGHRLHEFPRTGLDLQVPRIVEFVSAGTERTKFSSYADPENLLRQAKGPGFGLIELGPEEEIAEQRRRTLSLTALRSTDGSVLWRAEYAVVKGVGLIPIVGDL
ncbi:MAG TPA: alkaline phosphatase D family protein, partial [Actinomycetota bacterium]|nr:alkaline phosphatase D family protein [Actinomycetota bacterium]